ncbi:MAG: hypothetical protein GXO83_02085 [Chlorobi bacterium]|nr:hypothetical protein [Chlorobiota bacterium]
MNIKLKVIFLFFLFLIRQLSSAQNPYNKMPEPFMTTTYKNDSIRQKQYGFLQGLYDSIMNFSSNEALGGREYESYFFPFISTPLIPAIPNSAGSIIIRGKKYDHVLLQYDSYKDLLIFYGPEHQINGAIIPVVLNPFIIDGFSLDMSGNKMIFRYMDFSDSITDPLKDGYFELVYDGGCRFVIKHKSIIVIDEGKKIFKYKPKRYILNKGEIYNIRGKRSLLKALSDKSPEVKKFIKSAGISVSMADKEEMKSILTFYDSLKQP